MDQGEHQTTEELKLEKRGYLAYAEGVPLSKMPLPMGDVKNGVWRRGWLAAYDEDMERRNAE